MLLTLARNFRASPHRIFLVANLLTGLGVIALYSIAFHQETTLWQVSFVKQLLFLIPALAGFLLVMMLPAHLIHKYAYTAYGVMLLAISLPYLGPQVAGTRRWIDLGLPVNIQPAEMAKWILIIALARYLSGRSLGMRHFGSNIFPLVLVLIPTLIVLKQPDLGTALIILTPVVPMLFWAGARPYHLFLFLAPVLSVLAAFHVLLFTVWILIMAAVLLLSRPTLRAGVSVFFGNIFLGLLAPWIWSLLAPYQQKRILILINPDLDPMGAAYQIIQSKTAIGSGGLFGKGWGQGTQTHLKFLPVQESDFIVSVIGEELGFVTLALMILAFSWLILKIVTLAYHSKDRFASLVLIGVGTVFLAHVFINFAMTIGLIPVKGLPLPFVSYGGSFLVSCFIMVGLVMNLGINRSD